MKTNVADFPRVSINDSSIFLKFKLFSNPKIISSRLYCWFRALCLFLSRFSSLERIIRGAAHHLKPSDSSHLTTASPLRAPWVGARAPRGTHHRFKTHHGLGTIDALARSVSCCTGEEGKHAFCTSRGDPLAREGEATRGLAASRR